MRTLLLTHRVDTIGEMSCNPAIGGSAKDTWSARSTPWTVSWAGRSIARHSVSHPQPVEGAGGRGPRAQADRKLYRQAMQELLAEQADLDIRARTR